MKKKKRQGTSVNFFEIVKMKFVFVLPDANPIVTDDVTLDRLTMALTDDVVNDAVVVVVVVILVGAAVDSFAFDKFLDHNQPDLVLTVVVIFYVNLNYHHYLEIVVVIAWNIVIEVDTIGLLNSVAVAV